MERIDWKTAVEKLKIWMWLVAAMAGALALGIWILFRHSLPPELPVFYSLPWGEEQLAKPEFLAIPLGLTGVIAGLFPVLATKLGKDGVLGALIIGSGLTAEIVMTAAVLRIIIQVI